MRYKDWTWGPVRLAYDSHMPALGLSWNRGHAFSLHLILFDLVVEYD